MMKTCISTYSFWRMYANHGWTLFDAIDKTAELGADALRRALAPDFSVVERGCELTVFCGTEAVARRTARPDGSRRYENFVHGYAFTVRDARQ